MLRRMSPYSRRAGYLAVRISARACALTRRHLRKSHRSTYCARARAQTDTTAHRCGVDLLSLRGTYFDEPGCQSCIYAIGHGLYSHGVCSYGVYEHGLYNYGTYSYGLYSYGAHSHGVYSHGLYGHLPIQRAYAYLSRPGSLWDVRTHVRLSCVPRCSFNCDVGLGVLEV